MNEKDANASDRNGDESAAADEQSQDRVETADIGKAADTPANRLVPAESDVLRPRRRVDLQPVDLIAPNVNEVASLDIKEFKGVGNCFTPCLAGALVFHGIAYKPPGEFDAEYQILTAGLMANAQVASRAKQLTFVPALDWSTSTIALAVFKHTKYGARVLSALRSLGDKLAEVKVFVQWEDRKRSHVVRYIALADHERDLLEKIAWPTRGEIIDALGDGAFDDIDELAAANEEISALLKSREVT